MNKFYICLIVLKLNRYIIPKHLWLVFMAFSSILAAQDPFHYEYNIQNGLPSIEIYDSEIDEYGRLILTTDRGLSVYDGYNFNNFSTQDGLSNNTNFELIKAGNGLFYLCGIDGTVSEYTSTGIRPSAANQSILESKNTSWIDYLHQDSDSTFIYIRGAKYIDSAFKEIFSYNFNTNKIKEAVTQFVVDLPWFEIHRFNDQYFTKDKLTGYIGSMTKKFGDQYIVVYNQYANGLREKETTGHLNFSSIYNYKSKVLFIKDGTIQDSLVTKKDILEIYPIDNSLFICTNSGLIKYDRETSVTKTFFTNRTITSISKDKESNFWLTTLHGLIKVPSFDIKNLTNNLSDNIPREIESLDQGIIALSEYGQNIFSINKDGIVTSAFSDPIYSFTTLHETSKGVITCILNFVNINDDKIEMSAPEYLTFRNNTLVPSSFRKSILLHNGDIMCGRSSISVIRNRKMYYDGEKNKNKFDRISSIHQDKNGQIYVGCVMGLHITQEDDYENFTQIQLSTDSLNCRVSQIVSDSTHGVWISSIGNGLFFKPYETNDYLKVVGNAQFPIPALINCLKIQNDSTIWLGTNTGLYRYNYQYSQDSLRITNSAEFKTEDGINSNFIHDIEWWQEQVWITTSDGLNFFNPSDLESQIESPFIFLDSVVVGNKSLLKDSITELSRNENDLDFYFTGISFEKQKDKAFYKYNLKRNDEDGEWIYTNNRNVRYTNLLHGDYVFTVAAQNKIGNWSENYASFTFKIKKRLFEELWFRIFLFLLFLLAAYLIYKNRENQILKREKQNQLLREEQYKTKIAELDALRNQMNPHFIYNALNSIQNFVFQNNPEKANYYLSKFSRLMRSSLEMSKLEYVELDEEITFLENYMALEQLRFENKFSYQVTIDKDISPELKIPPLLLQPLIENCVKHAFKYVDYQGEIEISFKLEGQKIIIEVMDNGLGIEMKNENHKSLGMKIIAQRLDIINVKENSDISKIQVIDRRTTEGVNGTIVQITLPNK